MGLMDFLPLFKIEVDGQDISQILAPRLVKLSVTDGAGVQSDQVQFTLSDTAFFGKLQEPRQGAEITLAHIDQIDESDMNLLSRIARDHDAIAKPGNGRIIMAKRGESLTASGQPMPRVPLSKGQVGRWSYRNSLRQKAGSVVATYQDLGKGKPQECTAGEGAPVQHR
jgi:phage protein D